MIPLTKSYPHCKIALTMNDEARGALWKQVLASIEKDVSKGNFFTLFKPTVLLSLEDNIATVAAPSAMIVNLLEKRYLPTIKTALEQQTQSETEIVLIAKAVHPTVSENNTPLFSEEEIKKPIQIGHLPRVRPDFTFETLAVSDSNRLAFVSAESVAKNPGTTYNPLFIYGPVGVGKTHLMQAIANEVYRADPSRKIVYITSEEFTNEVVEAIRSNDTARMKKRFREARLLIIDDVQFIAGKDRVQEELFHTFNSLIDSGGQIVLSSDRPPSEIKKLEARLSSRFAGGLTVDVESPDFEMRTAIVLKKAEKFGFSISIDVAKVIAQRQQDVRSLEGALLRAVTEATTKNQDLTQEIAEKALNNKGEPERSVLHADDIIRSACEFFNIKPTQLKGPKREASLVKARQITMYLLKKELGMTFVEIGNLLGGRDHTTVMHGVEKMEGLASEKSTLQEEILGITKFLRG